MFIQKIKSDGLAHLSYIVGSSGAACVIDPRRDCEIYMDIAAEHGASITRIIETHRNEDLISGAPILSDMTGATVLHGPNADGDVAYAKIVTDGYEVSCGALRLRVIETPGHTYDSISIAILDTNFDDEIVGVFTGDALFVGDVGRTDFYPGETEKVAGLLYDSLQKLMELGDQALLYPAHGAGSVCGDGMADREFSTLGYERKNNPMLNKASREAFIEAKLNERHYVPPYFSRMEHLNLVGGSAMPRVIAPKPLEPGEFDQKRTSTVVDVRSIGSFASAHIPGSLAIPESMLSAFAGYFLDADDKLTLVADNPEQARSAVRYLARLGFDHVEFYLDSVVGYAANGGHLDTLNFVDTSIVKSRLEDDQDGWVLLDVRSINEFETGHIGGAKHLYAGLVPQDSDFLDPKKTYTVMCGSGARATVAASWMQVSGFGDVDVYLGSMGAWNAQN